MVSIQKPGLYKCYSPGDNACKMKEGGPNHNWSTRMEDPQRELTEQRRGWGKEPRGMPVRARRAKEP